MAKNELNILIGGPAGAGIEKAGKTLTLALVRGGYHVFANVEHMSQIRGGNNFLRIRVSDKPYGCHVEKVDIMVAFDKKTIEEHCAEMNEGGVIIFDNADECLTSEKRLIEKELQHACPRTQLLNVPLKKIAVEKFGNPLMANTVALGIVCGIIDFDAEILKKVLGEIFAKKSAEIIKMNEKAVDEGVKSAEKWIKDFSEKGGSDFPIKLRKKLSEKNSEIAKKLSEVSKEKNMFLTGNDALCLGAVKAGCKYIGAYPMTPASSILHTMARWAAKYGIVVKHTEDEISAVNSAIGAGFAGARAMTATSGGGFALMTEAVGLAGMNEVPIVIVNVMRPGPATGQPTRTEQGDLRQVIHSGQGDPVKIVLLPGDIEECFEMGFLAFNLAEKYQLPVIICYDKYLGESYFTVPAANFEKLKNGKKIDLKIDRGKLLTQKELEKISDYKRYLLIDDGISPRTVPGMKGGEHSATSYEHCEHGEICEDAENHRLMVEKRLKKAAMAAADAPGPEVYTVAGGNADKDLTFVTWGSCKAMCLEACEILAERGVKANVLQIKTAMPFRSEKVKKILSECKRPILVEQNATGQMGGLIAEHTGIVISERILRYDGRPMTAKYIIDKIKI